MSLSLRPSHPLRMAGLLLVGAFLPLWVMLFLLGGAFVLLGLASRGGGLVLVFYGGMLGLIGTGWLLRLFHVFRKPTLRAVHPEEAPELHEELASIRAAARGPRSVALFLVRGCGMGFEALPVLGPLGWVSHHWILGVFTMMYLTEREFHSAVGWEYAYWSNQHGWMNLQLKRILIFWRRVIGVAGEASPRAWKWQRIADRHLASFGSWVLRLCRAFAVEQILVADASVLEAWGVRTYSQVLLKQALETSLVEALFWPNWQARLGSEDPLEAVQAFLKAWPPVEAEAYLRAAMDGIVPTAPAFLALRLQMMGAEAALPMPPARSAFEALLGETAPEVCAWLAAQWRTEIERQRQQDRQTQEGVISRYRSLLEKEAAGLLTDEDALTLAELSSGNESPSVRAARLSGLVDRLPQSGRAWALHARFHLEEGDQEQGRRSLERLKSLSPLNEALCAEIWADHLSRQEGGEGLAQARLEALRLESLAQEAWGERKTFTMQDRMLPHQAPEALLSSMVAYLKALPEVRRAFLVRKELRVFPEVPVFLLGVVTKEPAFFRREKARKAFQEKVMQGIPNPSEGTLFVLAINSGNWAMTRPLKRVKGSEIYRRRHWWS